MAKKPAAKDTKQRERADRYLGSEDVPDETNHDDMSNGDGGWEQVTPDRSPWVVKEPGIVIMGDLLGRYSFGQGKDKRYFYQVRLTGKASIACVKGSGDDQEEVACSRGDVVSIGETFALERDLAPLTDDGGKYQVRIAIGQPERDKSGKPSFWPFKVDKRTVKPPTRQPRIASSHRNERDSRDERDSEDVPF